MKKLYLIILALSMAGLSFGQISGTYTIPGATYTTIASAISALNTSGVGAGGVTFNVTAGYTETFASPTAGYLTIATNPPTLANQVIFQKSGAGADPKITAGVGTGTMDAIIAFSGVSYVTFNGIDAYENAANTTTPTQMEWGYAILKASGTQGSQNITVKNCTISLNNTNTATWGIYLNNHTTASTTSLTVTTASGQSSNNKFYGNTITNCYNGIYLYGFADGTAPYTYYDQNNDIGSVTGNTINNFGGGAAAEYMVYVYYQNGVTIANCNISGTSATGNGSIYGIYGGTATNANVNIYGNTISIVQSAATTGYIYGIYNSGLGTGGTTNTLNIYNNTVQNCQEPNSTTSYLYAIYNVATAFTHNFYGNTVTNNVFGGSYYMYLCYTTSAAGATTNVYNNTVSNNSRSGLGTQSSSSYLYCLYISGSGTNIIHDNNVFGNSCPAQATYGAYIYSLYCSNSATSQMVYNNSVHDQTVTSSYTSSSAIYGIYSYPASTGVATNALYNNNVYNLTISNTNASGYGYIYGIYGYYMGNIYSNNLYNLTISNTSTGYGYGYGYYFGGAGNFSVYKNKLYNVSMAGASGYFYGMYISGPTTANVYNNYISDIKAPSSTTTTYGVYIGSGTNVNLYYNTIYLNASSSSATTFNMYAIYASTTPTVELRNNIVVNTSTAPASATYRAACYYRSSTTIGTYATTSNNNDFYAGTPSATNLIYYDGTNSVQTLAAYKALVSPREASSVTELPPFVNIISTPYDLHLKTTVATQCESGGSTVSVPSITVDYDNDARYPNAGYPVGTSTPSAPDIGADEFGGIILDLTPPNIGFTAFGNTNLTTARVLTTSITDATGVPTSGAGLPRLYWKINAGAWNNVAGVWVSGSTYTFTFGAGVVLNDVVSYYIVAQDLVATPNVGANPSGGASGYTINPPACSTPPTTPYTYTIVGTMCGNYNVGVGQTYTTLTAAVADLNLKVITCPVTLILTDAAYGASETFPIVLNNVAGSSAVNNITIKPGTGITPTISGSSATTLIKFNGANYVTIDGSNSGASDRSLTFSNTVASGTTAVIWVGSNGTGNGSNYITFKNCNVANGYNTSGAYGIFAGSAATIGTAGDDNDNLTIQNNAVSKAYIGIWTQATTTGLLDNLIINGNSVGSATATSYIGHDGIMVANATGALISQNTIYNIITTTTTPVGLTISTGVVSSTISRNNINNITFSSTGGYGGRGMYINTGNAASNLTFANNLIYVILGDAYGSFSNSSPVGIYFDGATGGLNIYHNSVYMSGNVTYASATITTAVLFYSATITNIDLRNNIFQNAIVNTVTSTSKSYAIYSSAPAASFTQIDYNDYFASGTQAVFGYFGADILTLAAWKTATGKDVNSMNVDPAFVSTTDLHPTNVVLQKACPYIAGAPNDYAGTLRTNPTDIGAYQVSSGLQTVTSNAATVILTTTATLNGSITANNLSVLSGFEYGPTTAYGTVVAGVPASVTGNSATGITAAISGLTPGTLYHFRAKGTSGAVVVNGGDLTFTTTAVPSTVVTQAASLVTGTTATLNGTVNANGSSTTTSFDYGPTVAYGTNVAGVPPTVSGSTVTGVLVNLTGLLPGTLYHFRINGVNGGGTTNGVDLTFTTPATAPTVVTNGASGIGSTTATLNGTVTANGSSTTVTFDWGLTIAYGNSIAATPGTVTGNTATPVTANLTGLTIGATYHYRCKGVNGIGTTLGTDQSFTTGCPQAGPAGTITGPISVCQGGAGYVYTVPPIANASGYVWTVPIGGTITAGNNTNTITVSYSPTAVSGYVFVYGTALCGNGSPSQLLVTVNPAASPTLIGPASACVNSTGNIYTTQSGMSNYVWTVSTGGTITGGGTATSNTVTVTWTTTGAKTVCVNYNSLTGCPALAPVCYNVTVNPLPVPTVTGPNPACTGIPGLTYSTQAGMANYIWTISAGGTITGGGTTNTITVTWNTAGAQTISVNYTNSNGCTATAPVVYPVTVNPTTIPVITGSTSLCANTGYYNYTTQPGMINYIWTISGGGTITNGQGTNVLQVVWTTIGAQTVSVIFTNGSNLCTAPSPTVLPVTISGLPDAAGNITGTASVCAGTNDVAYSVPVINNAVTYVWTLPTGAAIASGAGTNSITVNFANNAVSGNITVYGNSICGNGATSPPYAVSITQIPAAAGTITGTPAVCIGATGVVYSVDPIANATGYNWTVPANVNIVAGTNTNSITVDFSPAAVSGNFSVVGTNSCGNGTASPNYAVSVNPIPPAPVITEILGVLSSDAPSGNQWYLDGTAVPGANGQYYTPVQTGHYTDIVTLVGCSSSVSNDIYYLMTGIEPLVNGSSISVYPNPGDGLFTLVISTKDQLKLDLSVVNALGVTIYQQKDLNIQGSQTSTLDLRSQPDGVYSIILKNNNKHILKKIVINR